MHLAAASCVALLAAGFSAPLPSLASVRRPALVAHHLESRACGPSACAPSEDPPPSDAAPEDATYPGRELVRKFFDALFVVQSVITQALGFGLGLGLLLNLSGWGYTFTPDGLVVKPLAEMREDIRNRNFQREAARTMDEPPRVVDTKTKAELIAMRLRGGALRGAKAEGGRPRPELAAKVELHATR